MRHQRLFKFYWCWLSIFQGNTHWKNLWRRGEITWQIVLYPGRSVLFNRCGGHHEKMSHHRHVVKCNGDRQSPTALTIITDINKSFRCCTLKSNRTAKLCRSSKHCNCKSFTWLIEFISSMIPPYAFPTCILLFSCMNMSHSSFTAWKSYIFLLAKVERQGRPQNFS